MRAKFKTEAELRKCTEALYKEALVATADPNVVMLIPVKDRPGEFHVLKNDPPPTTKH